MKTPFNRNLKTLREKAKLTRVELAKELGVTEWMIRHWEVEGLNTPHYHLEKIADYFNVTFDELLREKTMKTISWNIALLRKEKGLSQESLAWDLDITRSRLSSWEEHRAEPGIDMIIKLSDYFHVTIDNLIKTDLRKCM